MSDPFDATGGGGSDPWQNLMSFGLATMAAGGQPGATTLGALGQGGMAAMNTSRENALAQGQRNYYQAETQSKKLANQLSLTQMNYQRQLTGQPALDANGMPVQSQQSNDVLSTAPSASDSAITPSNSVGMTFQPTVGSSARPPQQYSSQNGQTPNGTPYSAQDINKMLQGIYTGSIQATPEMARIVAPTAASMNLPIAQKLQDLAYNPTIAAETEKAKAPYEVHDIREGGALFQGTDPLAYGGVKGVAPDGTQYMIPAHSAATGGQFGSSAPVSGVAGTPQAVAGTDQKSPLGIRNNNPTNLKPAGWDGMTGTNGGYATFATPEDGIRAATLNLQSYNAKGWNTPLSIAEHWAPKGDGNNDPKQYGINIAKQLGVDPAQPLNLSDPTQASSVVHAIIQNENNQVPYHPTVINNGVNAALTRAPAMGGASVQTQLQNPNSKAPNASGLPAGAIQTGIGPSEEGFMKARGTDLAKKQGDWDTQAQGAMQNNFTLDQMRNESQTWRMGKWADNEATARQYLQGFGTLMGADKTQFDKPLGDYQAFQKSAGQLTREAVRETSSKAAFQEFQMIQKQLPSAEMSKGGFDTIVNQMQGVNDYKIARQSAANNWVNGYTAPDGTAVTGHKTLDGFEPEFNKNVTPSVFLLNRMAQNSPDDFKTMWANMQKDPNGQKVLQNIVSKQQYAHQNGLFE